MLVQTDPGPWASDQTIRQVGRVDEELAGLWPQPRCNGVHDGEAGPPTVGCSGLTSGQIDLLQSTITSYLFFFFKAITQVPSADMPLQVTHGMSMCNLNNHRSCADPLFRAYQSFITLFQGPFSSELIYPISSV